MPTEPPAWPPRVSKHFFPCLSSPNATSCESGILQGNKNTSNKKEFISNKPLWNFRRQTRTSLQSRLMGQHPERPLRSLCAACMSLDHVVVPDVCGEYEFVELRCDARLDNVKVAVSLSFFVAYFNDFFCHFKTPIRRNQVNKEWRKIS